MPSSKLQISSPLEAGFSLNESKQLPSSLTSALESISHRLARKSLQISLVVIRNDIPIPQSPPAYTYSATSPVLSLFDEDSPIRNSSRSSISSSSTSSTSSSYSRTKWPSLPSSPREFRPSSATSSTFTSRNISLLPAHTLTPRAEKHLRHAISHASKKYPSINSSLLPAHPLTTPLPALTTLIVRRSLAQNDVLFESAGLTLFGCDHVYIFKSMLATYARTYAKRDLRHAVDELRRYVLARRGPVSREELLRAYSSSVPSAAMYDVEEAYKHTYGGARRVGGIAGPVAPTATLPRLVTSLPVQGTARMGNVAVGESANGMDGQCTPLSGKRVQRSEDLTPVTRGEWSCLMVGEGWNEGRRVNVMTC